VGWSSRVRAGDSPEGVSSGTALGDHREPSATGGWARPVVRCCRHADTTAPPITRALRKPDEAITGLSRPLSRKTICHSE
jgi:hypothetical protein